MSPLIYPATFYVLYIFGLFIALMVVRVRAVKSGSVPMTYFSTYSGAGPREWMVVLGLHYDNQFQVPLLYLLTCAVLMQAGLHDGLTLALAWLFVAHLGTSARQRRPQTTAGLRAGLAGHRCNLDSSAARGIDRPRCVSAPAARRSETSELLSLADLKP